MLKSMTGYGRGKYETEDRHYCVEIKSVNHKYCDITIKLPRSLSFLEDMVRKTVLNNITRGKIDVFVSFTNNSEKGKQIKINHEIAKIYLKEIRNIAQENCLESNISVIELAKLPEVLTIENTDDEELLWNELKQALDFAMKDFIQMRKNEGIKMAEDMKTRIKQIIQKIEEISCISSGLVEEYIVKLEERIKELTKTDIIDQARLAQEVVIYSDKCSIQEEITRLKSHTNQFINLLESEDAVGKNMDFLIQEMNREINTIGAKANKLEITKLVVETKTLIEDIREQIQNIE